jgi:hypothetical protein
MTARAVDSGVPLRISSRLYERLKQVSRSNGLSPSEMLELLLRKYLIIMSECDNDSEGIGLSDDDI